MGLSSSPSVHWWRVRILLDECLPRTLARHLKGHDVETVTDAGWSGLGNGALLAAAAGRFDIVITIDQRFTQHQPIPPTVAVVTLAASSNRFESLRALVPALLDVLAQIRPGEQRRVMAGPTSS